MANKKTTTKTVKKTTKNTTAKVTKKPVTKVVKKEPVKKEVVKEEVKVVKRNKRVLLVGILYLLCALVWITGGISKIVVKEKGLVDILVGVFILIAAVLYFIRYVKDTD